MAAIRVPPGFRFMPTDAELISYFLEKKQRGLAVGCDRIVEKQVYGENATPWKVFGEDEAWNDCNHPKKKMIFVLPKICRVGNSNKKMCRVAGCGTWEGKAMLHNVKNSEGRIVGKKRAFTFKPRKGLESEAKGKGRWIMHEMSVDGYNYVICRITRDLSKGCLNHDKKDEKEGEISISSAGEVWNCDDGDDHQQQSYRKRMLKDQHEEEDSPHGKKLCRPDGSYVPSFQQCTDLIDLSFLFEDHEEEEICTANCSFSNAEWFTTYVEDLENCIC